jgi:hypothetical protein
VLVQLELVQLEELVLEQGTKQASVLENYP